MPKLVPNASLGNPYIITNNWGGCSYVVDVDASFESRREILIRQELYTSGGGL